MGPTAAGSYQPGIFLSEGAMGIPWESELMEGRGLGREPGLVSGGGYAKTLRLVTLLHETAHYLQDLTLGTCIQADRYSDIAGGHVFEAVRILAGRQERVGCPLVERTNRGLEGEAAEHLDEARKADGLAWALDDDGAYVQRFIDGPGVPALPYGLTGRMLIEGLTAVRVATLVAARAQSDEDVQYIKAARGRAHAARGSAAALPGGT